MLKHIGIGLFLITAICTPVHANGTATMFDGIEIIFIDCSIDTGSIINPIDIQRDVMVCEALAKDLQNNWLGKDIDISTPWIVTIGLQKTALYTTSAESLAFYKKRKRYTAQELQRRKAYSDMGAVLPMYIEGTDKRFFDIYLGMFGTGGRQYIGLEHKYLQIFVHEPFSSSSGPHLVAVQLFKLMPHARHEFSWKWSTSLCRPVMFEKCSMDEGAGAEFFPPATDSDFINLAKAQMAEQLRYMTTKEFEKKLAKQMRNW